MRRTLRILRTLVPILNIAALELAEADDNDTGTDDRIAQGIGYFTEVFQDISAGKTEIPLPPLSIFSKAQLEELKGQIEQAQEEAA